jgi:hypothetical protein
MDSLQVFKDYDEGMMLVIMQAGVLAPSFIADACRALSLFKARKRVGHQELH